MKDKKLFIINKATVWHRNKTIFEGLDFEWKTGSHLGIIGSNGSGKSAFLNLLSGKLWVSQGSLERPFTQSFEAREKALNPFFNFHHLIRQVNIRHDFKNESNLKEFYYQQRYNAHDADRAMKVGEYLLSQVEPVARTVHWTVDRVKSLLELDDVWHRSLIKLSNGESKRLRLAAALVKNPVILLLDDAFVGLDKERRIYFNEIFREIADSGIHLAIVCTPEEIPDVVTEVLVFDDCQLVKSSQKDDFNTSEIPGKKQVKIDEQLLSDIITHSPDVPVFNTVVELKNARVGYGEQMILDGLHWKVQAGERWALSGPNGSGKSTLLSLLNGDHPQAYACDLTLFDRKRGTGETIWDIKRKIGFMSPELYQVFPLHFTCEEVIVSGFSDALASHKAGTPEQQECTSRWIRLLDLEEVKDKPLHDLSASMQRLCLLARALVKMPPLLILDEPCQGLDRQHQEQFRQLIDKLCDTLPITLVYVTHYQEQLPGCVEHRLELK